MRAPTGLLWASVAFNAYRVSAEALVYISEAASPPSHEVLPSISPITARLLLAQRLGLSQYHSLEGADESTIEALNVYGVKETQLFGYEERREATEKLLVIVDGVSNPKGTCLQTW